MIKWFRKLWAMVRLARIEKALGIKLFKHQRKVVLKDVNAGQMFLWTRGSGKTTAAVIRTLVWSRVPIRVIHERAKLARQITDLREIEPPAIPDPDATDMRSLDVTLHMYKDFHDKCVEHGIRVSDIS